MGGQEVSKTPPRRPKTPARSIHRGPQGPTGSKREPQKATGKNREPQRGTERDGEPQRATEII